VFKNRVFDNNTDNFARKGAAVASVPAGSGVVLNSADKVEIFDNDIGGNKTANVIISSYWSTGYMNKYGISKDYDPYPEEVYVHGNRFKGGGDSPDGLDLKTPEGRAVRPGRTPAGRAVGWLRPTRSAPGPADLRRRRVRRAQRRWPNKYKNPGLVGDAVRCTLPALPAIVLPVRRSRRGAAAKAASRS
jgi:hypothetical protein